MDEAISGLQDLVRKSGTSTTHDLSDDSWYLTVSGEITLHLARRDSKFMLSQSERGRSEDLFFESSHCDAMEKFLTYTLCTQLSADNDLPFLLVAPVPMTKEDVAPGYTLSPNGESWQLIENATGHKFYADYVD